jgi:hypothetical protein
MTETVRLKVRTPDSASYLDVLDLLRGRAQIFVTSEKRRFIATGPLSTQLRHEVEARGGTIVVDQAYQPDLTASF